MNLRQRRHLEIFHKLETEPVDWDVVIEPFTLPVEPRGPDCCQLCGRPNLLEYFPLMHRKKNIVMGVGSECVKTWVESCYEDFDHFASKVFKTEIKEFKNKFFKEYIGDTKPKRNLAHRVYEMREDDSYDDLRKIYRLAKKLDFTIPEKIDLILKI